MGQSVFCKTRTTVLGIIYMQCLLQRGNAEWHVSWHQFSFRVPLCIHKLEKLTVSVRNVHCIIKGWNETVMHYWHRLSILQMNLAVGAWENRTPLKLSQIYRVSLSLEAPKNYVIEIMTWKFIYTYRKRWKTGPAHNRCWNWFPFTSKHTWMCFSKFWNTFPKASTLMAWISWRTASLSCSIVRGVFLHTLPFNWPLRKKSAGVRSASPCL